MSTFSSLPKLEDVNAPPSRILVISEDEALRERLHGLLQRLNYQTHHQTETIPEELRSFAAMIVEGDRLHRLPKPLLRSVRKESVPLLLVCEQCGSRVLEQAFLQRIQILLPKRNLEALLPSALQRCHQTRGQTDLRSKESATEFDWRDQVVQVMQVSLHCWTHLIGKTPVELALESRLWTATLDGSTFRVRGLERYLDLDKLPQRPKLPIVLETARFVLSQAPRSLESLDLEARLKMLEFTFAHLEEIRELCRA